MRSGPGWLAMLLSTVLLSACSSGPPGTGDYTSDVAAMRAMKDKDFAQASDSPIPKNKQAELLPLPYFSIDQAYNVPAALKPTGDARVLEMPTSTGIPRQYRRAGTLEFVLQGQKLTLTAFVEADAPNMNRLFVPFRDLTSRTETYPGGRYLDLNRTGTGYYELDYNRAYNPYCYYNASYECPLPPPENYLKIAIPAGEKIKPSTT